MSHTLTFSDEDMAVIERAIAELPFRVAAPLVQRINQQLSDQQQPADKSDPEDR